MIKRISVNLEMKKSIEEGLHATVRTSDDQTLQMRALESVGYSTTNDVAQLIREIYDEGSELERKSALIAMGRSAHDDWERYVIPNLDSPSPSLRAEAARHRDRPLDRG